MNPRARAILAAVSGAVLLCAFVFASARLPRFGTYLGPYGTVLNAVAPHERRIPNIITAVNFDYRGLDTMGEEYILFAAVAGLTLVLRKDRSATSVDPLPSNPQRGIPTRSDAVRAFSALGIGVTVAFGWYMAMHPHLGPGGGFQGGAITAGFVALIFLGLGYAPVKRLVPHERSERIESFGAVGYVLVGLATLALGGAFLANTLPLGQSGAFFSTGTIPIINLSVAIEVASGLILMFGEFADETRIELPANASPGESGR